MPLPEPVFLKALNISVKFCIPLFYLYTQSKFYTEVYPKPLLKATLHLWLTALKIPAQVAAFSSSDGGGGGGDIIRQLNTRHTAGYVVPELLINMSF